MKLISFLFSLLLFFAYLLNNEIKREEDPKQTQETTETAGEKNANISNFYDKRIKTLNKMLRAASAEEEREQAKLNHINTLNQYGVVVNDKNVKRVESDLYKAQRKRLDIEKQLYITEQKRRRQHD